MLDKLRRKFILIIMALVTAALAIMAGVIIFINYQQLSRDVESAVDYATTAFAFEGHAVFHQGDKVPPAALGENGNSGTDASVDPSAPADGYPEETQSAAAQTLEGNYTPGGRSPAGLQHDGTGTAAPIDGMERQARVQGADMVATSVYIVSNGTVSTTLVDALELGEDDLNSAVSQVCTRYESEAVQEGALNGYLDNQGLYYSIRQTPSGLKTAFASDAYLKNSIANLAMVLGGVSLCVWIAFLLVSIVLARWVVKPTERAWQQQQQFVADASHELKTPLAVMMANNSILLSHPDETIASQERWVESSQQEARQMLDLVNDMLFLARPQNTESAQVLEDVDFSGLVKRNALQFEAVCFEREIDLTEDVDSGLTVRGDANRLQRLVSTLIDNACKYADHRVEVCLHADGGKAVLSITNDGATIPPEDLPHVFDRFYRVDKARVRSEGGVGLGLAIAQEVAREHGGGIAVASSESAGTTFTASLPLA